HERCDALLLEQASAASMARPVFEGLLARLEPGDTLVVTSIDRAFRSTVDAITQAEALLARGINFEVLSMQVDTATADGMLAYTVVAAVATHERMRISERTKQGLAAARDRGARLGRPPKLSEGELAMIRARLVKPGATITAIAEEVGMAPWSLSRALRRGSIVSDAPSAPD
ncbi:MAG: recombinase family protein, partial [Pseudomonadota bacterium]